MDPLIRNTFIDIVGENQFSDQLIDRVSASADPIGIAARPVGVLWPKTTVQVSRILALANQYELPVVPRGAGTSLTGSVLPVRGGLVIDLIRMNRILQVSVEDSLVVVQPGVVYGELDRVLERKGFMFPPDPASARVCTIGGNVSTNAGGMKGAKYGSTRDYVLGLEVVLSDGRVMKTGRRFLNNSSGSDLTGLFVGSEGTLGIITEITLRILPRRPVKSTATALFDTLESAGHAISHVVRSGIVPSVLELMDENCIRLLVKHAGLELPTTGIMLLAETDGYSAADTNRQMDRIVEIFKENNVIQIDRAETQADAERLWWARRTIGPTAIQLMPDGIVEDVTIPISRIPEFLEEMGEMAKSLNLMILNYGHAGDGNFHPQIMYDKNDPDQKRRVDKAGAEIFRIATRLNGTLSGEHGIGIYKAPFMTLEHDEPSMDVMRKLKKTLDPKNILNPGKMALDN